MQSANFVKHPIFERTLRLSQALLIECCLVCTHASANKRVCRRTAKEESEAKESNLK
jgi:hypothetical protein